MPKKKGRPSLKQDFFRWPPVGVSVSGHQERKKLLEECEHHPLPFLFREQRVNNATWNAFYRKNARHRQKQAKSHDRVGKSGPGGADVEACPPFTPQHHSRGRFQLGINPLSKLAFAWGVIITLLDASYSAFLIPITCAFQWDYQHATWLTGLDLAAGLMFWLDIGASFLTGFIAIYNLKRLVVTSPSLIARYYVFHGSFWYDVVSAIPALVEVVVLCRPGEGGETLLHVIFLLRLARLLRVFKMVTWLIQVVLVGKFDRLTRTLFSAGQTYLLSLLYAGLVLLNLLACLWVYVASWEGFEHSWVTSVGPAAVDISGDGPVRIWVAAMFFTTATVSTVGYGDIAPVSAGEEIVAIFMMLVGLVVFGFIISGSQELLQYLAPRSRELGLLRKKMEEFEIWADKRQISSRLRGHCTSYFTEVWLHHTELQTSTIFAELPSVLQADICHELTADVFATSIIFKGLDKDAQLLIAARLRPVSVSAGHDLCRQGDKADCMWLLEEGEVLAIRHGHDLELMAHPTVLGEAAVLAAHVPACQTHAYTLRAVSQCMTWELSREDMDFIFEMHPAILDRIMLSFRERLHQHMEENKALYKEQGWDDVLGHIDNTRVPVLEDRGAASKGERPGDKWSGSTKQMDLQNSPGSAKVAEADRKFAEQMEQSSAADDADG